MTGAARRVDPRTYLVAESAAMRAVVSAIETHAGCDGPVLICGERGTGRELVARCLHLASRRRQGRFLAVRPSFDAGDGNGPGGAAAVGADDDEVRARRALRAAQGGTLLVKDVCDVPAGGQRTLRRAMRAPDASRRPDSSGETYDVRLIGSGGSELERAVAAHVLSRELYDGLAVRRIDVPALRQRASDIPTLVERWVRHYADEVGRPKLSVSTRAHERLVIYPWPGNVAELKDLVRRLVLETDGARIDADHVDGLLPRVAERVPLEDLSFEDMIKAKLAGFLHRMDGYEVRDLYEKVIERVERPLFELVLARTGGNQVKAAAILGLNRNTLRKKLESQGVATGGRKGRQDRALDD
jgi:two-component system nitrogen regulation response regulator GlnG